MLALLILWLVMDVVIMSVFFYMPVTRGEEAFFGVRVSPEVFSGQGREILRRYRFWLVSTFVELELIALLLFRFWSRLPFAHAPSTLLLASAALILYINYYRQVKMFRVVDEKQRFASS